MMLRVVSFIAALSFLAPALSAQIPEATAVSAQVPPLIQFSNVALDEGGNPVAGRLSLTFSLYASQKGGEPLWTEEQTDVQLDQAGRYSVQLGIATPGGVPTSLFAGGESRWLSVRIPGQPEQPRVLLVSVPYALKAGDAATIGGLPPSAFLRSDGGVDSPAAAPAAAETRNPASASTPASTPGGAGASSFIPLWTSASVLGSSVLFQSGTGSKAKVGIGTVSPATALDVIGASTFRGALKVLGNAISLTAGDPGCGAGYGGLGFPPKGGLTCTNYALLGSASGDTFINSTGVAGIHFRSNNNELVSIDNDGNLAVTGQNGGGGLSVSGNLSIAGAQNPGAAIKIAGDGNSTVAGDPGCGSGIAGVGFPPTGSLSGCTNYALAGGTAGNTYLNSNGTGWIHFRSNNNELATIDNDGNMRVIGQNGGGSLTVAGKVHSGNVAASVSASNTVALNLDLKCSGTLTTYNSDCVVPDMKLTETTAGGPVMIMANLGGVLAQNCVVPFFYLVMDGKIIAETSSNISGELTGNSYTGDFGQTTVPLMSLQAPAAGSHTFLVQESDDYSFCGHAAGVLVVWQTEVSASAGQNKGPNGTRILMVHEL